MEYFVSMMEEGKPTLTKGKEILSTMKIVDAILLSLKKGRMVRIE